MAILWFNVSKRMKTPTPAPQFIVNMSFCYHDISKYCINILINQQFLIGAENYKYFLYHLIVI